jgi:hypothetical protein
MCENSIEVEEEVVTENVGGTEDDKNELVAAERAGDDSD